MLCANCCLNWSFSTSFPAYPGKVNDQRMVAESSFRRQLIAGIFPRVSVINLRIAFAVLFEMLIMISTLLSTLLTHLNNLKTPACHFREEDGTVVKTWGYLSGDQGYAITNYLQTPFPGKTSQKCFDYQSRHQLDNFRVEIIKVVFSSLVVNKKCGLLVKLRNVWRRWIHPWWWVC